MFRESLPEDQGMLFVFPAARSQRFYMKNCLMDIDIAYLAHEGDVGTIIDIQTMKVQREPGPAGYKRYPSPQPVAYVLEMAGGWYAEHGIQVGDRVRPLPALARQ